MSTVNDTNKVDLIGIDKECNYVNLEIIDPLTWEQESEHLSLLQKKINLYLSFIESGDIYEVKPEAKDKKIFIQIVFEYELSNNAIKFLFTVANILYDAGYKFGYTIDKPYKMQCIPIV